MIDHARWRGHALSVLMSTLLFNFAGKTYAQADRPSRVISINMCTDQFLLDMAARQQILGLSPFAGDTSLSWAAKQATGVPLLSGTAEEVLMLKPDLVVGWRFTKRQTRDLIRAHGIAFEEFDTVFTLADAKAQMRRFGTITGAIEKANARIAELDAAILRLRAVAKGTSLRVLPLARRGWVAGPRSVISDLLIEAGLTNAAIELGLSDGGFVALEAIATLRPDAILIAQEAPIAEDQGSAMLLHPAIAALFPPERRIIIPGRLTVCGGPMLVEAIDRMAAQLARLQPREAAIR